MFIMQAVYYLGMFLQIIQNQLEKKKVPVKVLKNIWLRIIVEKGHNYKGSNHVKSKNMYTKVVSPNYFLFKFSNRWKYIEIHIASWKKCLYYLFTITLENKK